MNVTFECLSFSIRSATGKNLIKTIGAFYAGQFFMAKVEQSYLFHLNLKNTINNYCIKELIYKIIVQ